MFQHESHSGFAMLASDNELLGKHLYGEDPAAFEELVRRHSAMVMGVCKNMLLHQHDAEDAFQGTFLILSRKAKSLIEHGSIAGWLYQVAIRNCLQIRRRKSRAKETQMTVEPTVGNNEPWLTISKAQDNDLIYQEINRLPARYRDVIVLCHLEGRSRSEAAELLDRTESAVKASLARGRNQLRKRLIKSGLMTSAILVMLHQSTNRAAAAVSENLITATIQNCSGVAPTVSVGTSSNIVHSLANQGILSMQATTLLKSFSIAAGILLMASVPLVVIAQQTETGGVSTAIEIESSDAASNADSFVSVAPSQQPTQKPGQQPSQQVDPTGDDVPIATTKATPYRSSSPELASKAPAPSAVAETDQFSIANSREYWKLMKESFQIKAMAMEKKARLPQYEENERLIFRSEAAELQAKMLEAELNIKRIKFEAEQASKAKSIAQIGEASQSQDPANTQVPQTFPTVPVGSELDSARQTPTNIPRSTATKFDYFPSIQPHSTVPPASTTPVSPGEALLVEVSTDSSLNRRVVVQADHKISMPLAGTFSVKGKTLSEIEEIVNQRLVKYLKNPESFVCREGASSPVNNK